MPQRRNYPFYQIDLMCALALPHDPLRAESREIDAEEIREHNSMNSGITVK